jgi:VWFA-related protein
MRRIAVSFVLVLTMAAPVPMPAQGNSTIHTETKVVLVDAVATDKKGYVHNLTAKDFEVFEDGKKQTVTSLSWEADPAAASNAQAHYTVLLFDDASMDNSDQRRARDAAIQFVETNAGSGKMVAIVNLRRGALQVTQNFTDNAGRLKAVLGGEAGVLGVNGAAPNLASAAGLGAGSLFLAVRNLALDLASSPGRKTLVLLSAESQLKTEGYRVEINAALDACNRANVAIYGIETRSHPRRASMAALEVPPSRGARLGHWLATRGSPVKRLRRTNRARAAKRQLSECFPVEAADSSSATQTILPTDWQRSAGNRMNTI